MGCEQGRLAYNLPPAERLMEPGPGVGGPGPGVIPPVGGMEWDGYGWNDGRRRGDASQLCWWPFGGGGGCARAAAVAAAMSGSGTSQIAFLGEDGIQISWDVSGPAMFDSVPLVTPGRQDFLQGSIYRLRLSNIPGREGGRVVPDVGSRARSRRGPTPSWPTRRSPCNSPTEDFDQVTSGNFVTKVIYLPDPEFQELTLSGVETLVSTRLDPGVDPIAEADRRGSILAIVRMGNKDFREFGRNELRPYGPRGRVA